MPENKTLNDGLVSIYSHVVNINHLIAILALIPANWYFLEIWSNEFEFGTFRIILMLGAGNLLLVLSYVLLMGTIGIFISIDQNLKRLVDLQRGTSETPRQQAKESVKQRTINCPHCNAKMSVTPSSQDRTAECPNSNCSKSFVVKASP